ncbi:hypothetical protein MNBD_ALPHA04-1944 [hydrothermal vent metagenome]|uniref:Bacterial surface antigen (D15) domain-containing protein n=1 Tax=hydrothermal vent metagenome TaxID=652676 RepID=A0A3B0RV01_9ZZZZ
MQETGSAALFMRNIEPENTPQRESETVVMASYFAPPGLTSDKPQYSSRSLSDKQIAAPAELNSEIRASRWSFYAWTFLRENGDGTITPNLGPSGQGGQYGASQAGAILNYRITGNTDRGLSLFARGSTALAQSGEEEVAIGAKVKPISQIPFSLHAERRFGNPSNRNRGVAIYVAGGTEPISIVDGLKLETYGQAGYVFDDRDSYFFDGSATLQMKLVGSDRKRVSVGTGIWTGGQRGVARLDIGPRLDIRFPLAGTAARLSVDWRQRVAGNAEPGSGVAITLSSGF